MGQKVRLLQIMCKPPEWCKIEASHRRLYIRCGRINGREPHQQEREKRDDKQSQQNDGDSPNEIPPGPLCHKTTSK